MKKEVLILPLLLLTACAEMTGDAYDSEEFYADEAYTEETGIALEEQTGLTVEVPAVAASQPAQRPAQQPPAQNARISPDGTMIELPAQQIFIGDVNAQEPAPQYAPAPLPPMAYSVPAGAEPQPLPPPMPPKPAVVTLQNIAYPNTFAQCAAEDTGCIASYEYQGYRRLSGTPQFAGYQDQLTHSDYPERGQWRNGNNIPRW